MRYGLLLFALVASAQQPDPRGFVNERLLRPNFVKNALPFKARPRILTGQPPAPVRIPAAPRTQCAIPLLEVLMLRDVDKQMVLPTRPFSGDDKMILPTIPVCGKR